MQQINHLIFYKILFNLPAYRNLNNVQYFSNNPLPEGAVTLLPATPAANATAKKQAALPALTNTSANVAPAVLTTTTPTVAVAAKKEEPLQIKPSVSVTLVPVFNRGAPATTETPLNLSTTPPQVNPTLICENKMTASPAFFQHSKLRIICASYMLVCLFLGLASD